jgi:hypothetical protein
VISVHRSGVTYSEAHMGYGEGRSQYLINQLELLDDKALVLIEEPETSLHQSAQYEFGRYLVDVSIRKGHQIYLTSHSEWILNALPPASIMYLNKGESGIDIIPGLTPIQARSLMTQGHSKALTILVEDNFAKAILGEILRRTDPNFLTTVGIHAVGGADEITKTIRSLQDSGICMAAVLDGDQAQVPKHNIFKLPGTNLPEREVFGSTAVKTYVLQTYGLNLDDFLSGLNGVDHHQWCSKLAERVSLEHVALANELARVYVSSIPEAEITNLWRLLREASRLVKLNY